MTTMGVIGDRQSHACLHSPILVESHSCLFAYVGERSITVVVVQDVGAGIASDIDIGPAITVEVGRDRGQAVTSGSAQNAGFLRNVRECAIAVIVIKNVR